MTCPAGSEDCGYVSDGQNDQADWEHMYWEHQTCTECGREPRDGDSVTHAGTCPRLWPEYVYPEVSR